MVALARLVPVPMRRIVAVIVAEFVPVDVCSTNQFRVLDKANQEPVPLPPLSVPLSRVTKTS